LIPAGALAPHIKACAEKSEQPCRLALPAIEAIRGAGLFRLWIPQTLGGNEI